MNYKKIISSATAIAIIGGTIPFVAQTFSNDAPDAKAAAYSSEITTEAPTYPEAIAELYQPSDELLFVGNSFYLGYVKDSNYNISFSSSDESIATVDKDGLVTILSTGTVTITEEVGYKNSAYSDYATDSITLEITKESIDAEPTSDGLTYEVQYDGTAIITGYEGNAINVEIPETIDGLTVSGLKKYCFSGNTNISSIKISGEIGTISEYAFRACKNLKSIDMGENITSIDTYAFYGCSLLEEIILPETLQSISTYSFYNCDSLKTIELPETLTSIGSCAFFDCDGLESITIPGSVSSIESQTFYWCDNLKTITLEYGVRYIKEKAFSYCTALESISIPESVTSIGGYAFANCYALESISIPGSVKTINDYTFDCCNELKNIVLGEGVQEISDKAFYIYDYDGDIPLYLESITLPGTISVIPDYAFRDFTTLKSVTIGEGTTGIGINAFSCTGLEEITIPGTVNVINSGAFAHCTNLKTVTIKDGVKSIGESAFYGCTTLETVIIPASVVQIKDGALNSSFTGTIYGYEGSTAQEYALANGFNFELLSETPDFKFGDSDLNGVVELNDAVKIMCWIADEQNNPMTDEEKDAGDVYQRGDGLNNMDALAIQKYKAQLISELPESTL